MNDNQKPSALTVALGRQIAAERTAAGHSIREFAARSGMSPESVWRYENAERTVPLEKLNQIAAALGLLPSHLLASAEERASREPSGD